MSVRVSMHGPVKSAQGRINTAYRFPMNDTTQFLMRTDE